ncbi:MAG: type II toxin-antitoxin system VapC family toxin [Thermomicrobiales bacterium]
MTYLVDSDVVIDHVTADPTALQLLDRLASAGLAVSTVTYMEVYEGYLRSRDSAMLANFDAFMAGVEIILFSVEIARRCAELREELRQRGRRVRSRALDLLTAATALEHGFVLVTRNTADYNDIPGLTLI